MTLLDGKWQECLSMEPTYKHFTLKPEVIDHLKARKPVWGEQSIGRVAVVTWMRDRKFQGRHEYTWADMLKGEPVGYAFANAFLEFLREERNHPDIELCDIFDPSLSPMKEGHWINPWSIANAMLEHVRPDERTYLHNPKREILAVARLIAYMVGHKESKPGDAMDEEACISRGEAKLQRSVHAFAAWLLELIGSELPVRLVMYVIHQNRRIGATVVLPLNDETFQRLCAGELHHSEITRSNLDFRKGKPFIFIACDPIGPKNISAHFRSLAQLKVLFYQLAHFTRELEPYRPQLVAVASHPDYQQRAKNQGLIHTGFSEKGTEFPVMALAAPEEMGPLARKATALDRAKYRILSGVMHAFVEMNKDEWESEDKPLG